MTPGAPPEFVAALRRNPKAARQFERIPPSHQREYFTWIADAKKPETRVRRVASAIERIVHDA